MFHTFIHLLICCLLLVRHPLYLYAIMRMTIVHHPACERHVCTAPIMYLIVSVVAPYACPSVNVGRCHSGAGGCNTSAWEWRRNQLQTRAWCSCSCSRPWPSPNIVESIWSAPRVMINTVHHHPKSVIGRCTIGHHMHCGHYQQLAQLTRLESLHMRSHVAI